MLAGGVTEVSGATLASAGSGERRHVARPAGGTLTQAEPRSPAPDSGGTFVAQGSGVLSLSNVLMGATSSATGTGTIRFAGGTSRVAAGADYAAGITEIGDGGVLDFDDDGSTGALRFDRQTAPAAATAP